MTTDIFEEINGILNALEREISALVQMLSESDCEIHLEGKTVSKLQYVERALLDFYYSGSKDGRMTNKYRGVVVCQTPVIDQIATVNQIKDSFAEAKKKLLDKDERYLDRFGKSYFQKSMARQVLKGMTRGRLCFKQVTRHIPCFNEPVTRIHYSQYRNGRSIVKVTPESCERMLLKLNETRHTPAEHIAVQLSMLGNHPHSVGLVQIRPLAVHDKVNLINQGTIVKTLCPSLPIFVSDTQVDKISFASKAQTKRESRSDKKFEDTPFLPSIHVYREIC